MDAPAGNTEGSEADCAHDHPGPMTAREAAQGLRDIRKRLEAREAGGVPSIREMVEERRL